MEPHRSFVTRGHVAKPTGGILERRLLDATDKRRNGTKVVAPIQVQGDTNAGDERKSQASFRQLRTQMTRRVTTL